MRVGDLVRIKPEHCEMYHNTWCNERPPDDQWIGLITHVWDNDEEMIEVMWGWSGISVAEYTEHLEVICNKQE